jgi:uncharacterized repeat protein (TIGR04076 family)
MAQIKNRSEATPGSRTNRRAFCRKAALAALGLWAAPKRVPKEANVAKTVKAIQAKVLSVKGECGIHKVGDVCAFTTEGVQGKVCIHAMYSMLPKVFAMMYGATFPWLKDPDVATHACPDAANPVVFEIARIYEG